MPRDRKREVKVGALVLAALALFAVGVFLIGDRTKLWALKNTYSVRFLSVAGLHTGNPVHLGGVHVGNVRRIVLPEDIEETELTVWISVDRRYAERIRADSVAHLRTMGLLGDKYIEITSGSPGEPVVPSGGRIASAPLTDVDQLLASGEDVVRNLVAISHSMVTILSRLEGGEGLLGELMVDSDTSRRMADSVVASLESLERVLGDIEAGKGVAGRLLRDDDLGDRFASAVERLEGVLVSVHDGEGLLAALISDAEMRDGFAATLGELERAAVDLRRVAGALEGGDGLLPRILNDEEYGRRVTEELEELVSNLNVVAERLHSGDGTAAKLLNDPDLYEAMNDIVVGVNESSLLRWLVRNRQKSGIRKRYEEEMEALRAGEEAEEASSDGDR